MVGSALNELPIHVHVQVRRQIWFLHLSSTKRFSGLTKYRLLKLVPSSLAFTPCLLKFCDPILAPFGRATLRGASRITPWCFPPSPTCNPKFLAMTDHGLNPPS